MNNKTSFVKRNIEFISIGLITIITCYLIASNFENFLQVYFESKINDLVINVFGILLGLLLTAYAILFGLVPSIRKELLHTKAMDSVNFRFFLATMLSLLVLAIGLIIYFVKDDVQKALVGIQIILVIFLIQLFALLIIYLLFLFKITRNYIKE